MAVPATLAHVQKGIADASNSALKPELGVWRT